MVTVTISETYDLSTKTNKMSLVGIHTPSFDIIKKTYPGLLLNHKFIRFRKADVKLACASMLPADPSQIGVEAGDIAPQDLFNPIMYKAVSNEAMTAFELRMHGIREDARTNGKFLGESLDKTDEVIGTSTNEFPVYYTLLANRKGWKVAHPQRGLVMASLRPYVFTKYYNMGDDASFIAPADGSSRLLKENESGGIEVGNIAPRNFRGAPRPMPPIPTAVVMGSADAGVTDLPYNLGEPLGTGGLRVSVLESPGEVSRNILSYVGLIVMPPCRLNRLYYRLVVRWTIDFIGCRPVYEVLGFGGMATLGGTFYGSDFEPISKNPEDCLGMVDVRDAELTKVMEGA